ncbi:hypothetical protein SDC9_147510 [bioreactor metagenome]|uniref:Uncharacterized protein n=1 Tax=bioreactor metagenome TaxID=1076179 RepID=A0A645EFV6_9ZZZZ
MPLPPVGGLAQLRFQFLFRTIEGDHFIGRIGAGPDDRSLASQRDLAPDFTIRITLGIGLSELDLGTDYAIAELLDSRGQFFADLLTGRIGDGQMPAGDTDVHDHSFLVRTSRFRPAVRRLKPPGRKIRGTTHQKRLPEP